MNWEQRYRLRHPIRTSLVPRAAASLVAALVCAPAVRWLDKVTGWGAGNVWEFITMEVSKKLLDARGPLGVIYIYWSYSRWERHSRSRWPGYVEFHVGGFFCAPLGTERGR